MAPLPHVVVVGCGLGGLATGIALKLTGGFEVTLLEASRELGDIGAGIQVSPNCSRLLIRWGCEKYLRDTVVLPKYGRVVRWQNGKVLTQAPMMPLIEQKFGFPHWNVHRGDLHNALRQRLEDMGVTIRCNAKVVDADLRAASVTLHSGEQIPCDFIVGADGIRSAMRDILFGQEDSVPPQATGDYCYRFTCNIEDMTQDPALAHLADVAMATGWWGPEKHVVGYKLRGETMYNVVTVFPDDGSMEYQYKTAGELSHLRELYRDWCPEYDFLSASCSVI
ncbi:hypothetical protein M8818_003786 [Zalaria obscura]|uniref:Uncharacterized protein n=1 Tax=Zalaria obscura TaxID=2024903 RepID=A0ACC3SEB5_9PEZI